MARGSKFVWVAVIGLGAGLGLGTAGCTSGQAPASTVNLTQPATIVSSKVEAGSDSHLDVTASGNLAKIPSEAKLPVQSVDLQIQSGDAPRLAAFRVPLGNLDISADKLPPNGLELRDIAIEIPEAVSAQVMHAQADALELQAHTPLRLTMSMVLPDGSLYKLAPSPTAPIDLDVQVVESSGRPVTTVTAHCSGICWELGGIVQLRDATVFLAADSDVAAR